ncbi:hypothetical protein PVMG_04881 [Plasmodium vivax Mauritania I]|uniref:Uncharacterized protein n=1 Tax=Plasmodium vivax Mauritania I TaxID=1035515 RepID=A0A0J9T7N5_PLAVI|nr:hypothetical protein PVMG_04881 [Plasmodium vivax Mauritania I]
MKQAIFVIEIENILTKIHIDILKNDMKCIKTLVNISTLHNINYCINENEEIPKIFYMKLNEPNGEPKYHDLVSYNANRRLMENSEKIEILDKLSRNIKLLNTVYTENLEKRCRDLNHWINEKIKKLEDRESWGDLKTNSLGIFNDIKNKTQEGLWVCGRKDKLYSPQNAELMKELDDYCEIRDKYGCDLSEDNKDCLKCNKYIMNKKQEFTRKMQCICSNDNCSWTGYTINTKCSLNNMNITFPEINCKGLDKKEELQESVTVIKKYSPLEIGFFILVFFILFYFFTLFLEKVK